MASTMNLSRRDLNLLVTLRALLEEKNVTRAGERVGLSQPATSNALRRLRAQFHDELLVRSGNSMDLTPFARSLLDAVSDTLALAERTYQLTSAFDPQESARTFTILGGDYGLSLLAAPSRRLDSVAPRVGLHLQIVRDEQLKDPDQALRRFDLVIAPQGWLRGFASLPLAVDEWIAIVDRDNPHVGDSLELADIARHPLVSILDEQSTGGAHIQRLLRVLGVDAASRISVGSFFEVPFFVEHTDRLGLLPRRLVDRFSRASHVRAVELPFGKAPITESMYWHPLADSDPGHRWLRQQLHSASRE